MSLESDLTAGLLPNDGLRAKISDRLFWDKRPEGSKLPCVVLERITPGGSRTTRRRIALQGPRIQARVMAASSKDLTETRDAFIAAMEALPKPPFQAAILNEDFPASPSVTASPGAQGKGSSDIHQTSLEHRVWHHPA